MGWCFLWASLQCLQPPLTESSTSDRKLFTVAVTRVRRRQLKGPSTICCSPTTLLLLPFSFSLVWQTAQLTAVICISSYPSSNILRLCVAALSLSPPTDVAVVQPLSTASENIGEAHTHSDIHTQYIYTYIYLSLPISIYLALSIQTGVATENGLLISPSLLLVLSDFSFRFTFSSSALFFFFSELRRNFDIHHYPSTPISI